MTIHIRFEVTPTEGRAEALAGRAEFFNGGDAPVSFLPMQVESASLALEIVDDSGSPVPLPPPPVPDPAAVPVDLAPGHTYEVTYPGVLPAWTEPGRYRARARLAADEAAVSEWVDLTLVA